AVRPAASGFRTETGSWGVAGAADRRRDRYSDSPGSASARHSAAARTDIAAAVLHTAVVAARNSSGSPTAGHIAAAGTAVARIAAGRIAAAAAHSPDRHRLGAAERPAAIRATAVPAAAI